MFDRGITNPKFVDALKKWPHWKDIISDKDLFVGIRNEYINIYYQGCSLFKISYKEADLYSRLTINILFIQIRSILGFMGRRDSCCYAASERDPHTRIQTRFIEEVVTLVRGG